MDIKKACITACSNRGIKRQLLATGQSRPNNLAPFTPGIEAHLLDDGARFIGDDAQQAEISLQQITRGGNRHVGKGDQQSTRIWNAAWGSAYRRSLGGSRVCCPQTSVTGRTVETEFDRA